MSTETIERTFTVDGPAQLKVENIAGLVTIQPGATGTIQVTATKHTDKGDPEKTRVEIEQADDGSVRVATKYNSIGWTRRSRPCKVDYAIIVPEKCSVKASSISGKVEIHGLEGKFKLKSVSGAMNLKSLTGKMQLTSVSGKISASELDGPIEAENVSGKIAIQDSQIASISGKTVSGDFKIESPLISGPYSFSTVSGRVTLVVPGDTHCTITQSGISGSIKSNLPVTQRKRSPGNEYVEVQGGGTAISFNSISGQVRLLSPDAPEVEPAVSTTPAKNQLEILQAIESGELSVDEALKEMNAS